MTEHSHHWLIPENPVDSAYASVCRDCGESKTFRPWLDEQKYHRQYNGSGAIPKLVRGKPKEWQGERA